MTSAVRPASNPPDLVAPRDRLVFFDRQSVTLAQPMTPLQAWERIMSRPLPGLGLAFAVRDAISAIFGVRRIGGFFGKPLIASKPGDPLDLLLIVRAVLRRLQ